MQVKSIQNIDFDKSYPKKTEKGYLKGVPPENPASRKIF